MQFFEVTDTVVAESEAAALAAFCEERGLVLRRSGGLARFYRPESSGRRLVGWLWRADRGAGRWEFTGVDDRGGRTMVVSFRCRDGLLANLKEAWLGGWGR